MTLLDIIVFGYTTQVYHMSPDNSKIKQNYDTLENVVQHNKTVKEIVFPDWDELLWKEEEKSQNVESETNKVEETKSETETKPETTEET